MARLEKYCRKQEWKAAISQAPLPTAKMGATANKTSQ